MKTSQVVGVVAVLGVAAYLWMRNRAAPPVANLSPGAIGARSHAADVATGGAFSALGGLVGSWFGGGASSPGSVGTDTSTPPVAPAVWNNPVSASPSVLPYSYKQQVIDTPTLLGTTTLFTPSDDGSGASGSYVDSNPAGTTTNFDSGFSG